MTYGAPEVWTPKVIQQLRDLWAVGYSTAEIGRRLGLSKNAIVGKAHRLDLDARPSPIRLPNGSPRPPASVPRAVFTLPPLPAMAPIVEPPRPVVAMVRDLPVFMPVVLFLPRASSACCWPIGEPRTKAFRFCDEAALPSKPYCRKHHARAHPKVADRRDVAA